MSMQFATNWIIVLVTLVGYLLHVVFNDKFSPYRPDEVVTMYILIVTIIMFTSFLAYGLVLFQNWM